LSQALLPLQRYEEAEKELAHAVRLIPQLPNLRGQRALALHELQRFEDAIEELDHLLRSSANQAFFLAQYSFLLAALGRFEEAEKRFKRLPGLAERMAPVMEMRTWTLALMGRFEEALAAARKAPQAVAARVYFLRATARAEEARKAALEGSRGRFEKARILEQCYVLAVAGQQGKARELLGTYDFPWNPYPMHWRARIHVVLGENDTALEWLSRAIDKGLSLPPNAAPDPEFAPLRNDPRFERLQAKLRRPRPARGK
jgi:tetratricopeptide (TPR) repeat protein